MKKFLKRANRGLVLSAIALLVLVIYISIDYITFSTQKKNIESKVSSYIDTVITQNQNVGTFESQKDSISKVVDDYWTNYNLQIATSNKTSITSQISALNDTKDVQVGAKDASYSIKSVSITKSGPHLACATIAYSSSFTGSINNYLFNPVSIDVMENYNTEYYEKSAEDSDQDYTLSLTCDVTAYLVYKNGNWKICSWDSFIRDASMVKVENK